MKSKYKDLSQLMNNEPQAKNLFNSLPDYIKTQIVLNAMDINTIENLQYYAENLLLDDD